MRVGIRWQLIPGTADYAGFTAKHEYKATYVRTIKGFGCFNVTRKGDKRVLCTGGLPDFIHEE